MLRIPVEADPALAAPAWIEVDLGAVAHNVRVFRRRLPSSCRLVAVVKANAYGHGLLPVARTVLQHGAVELAVAGVAEGAALRAGGVRAPILIAGPVTPAEAGAVVRHALVPSLGGIEVAAALAQASRRQLPVHVEVDTGMSRHGVPPAELGALVRAVQHRGRLAIAGVFTHFAATGPGDAANLSRQLQRFTAAVDAVPELRGVPRHACNTLGATVLPAAHLDAVRVGGGLYGFDPFAHPAGGAGAEPLRPVLRLLARLAALRDVPAGTAVGYGGAFRCRRSTRLALLPLGYADGLVRELWHGAMVLLHGVRVPIVGAVSMNQTVLDVTDVPQATTGDVAVLLGEQGGQVVRAEERVGPGGAVYEVTALLRADLPRRYLPAGPPPREEWHGPRR